MNAINSAKLGLTEAVARTEAQTKGRPGNGLGLSLAAAVAGLHHGRLVLADNAPGLRVTLTLARGTARNHSNTSA